MKRRGHVLDFSIDFFVLAKERDPMACFFHSSIAFFTEEEVIFKGKASNCSGKRIRNVNSMWDKVWFKRFLPASLSVKDWRNQVLDIGMVPAFELSDVILSSHTFSHCFIKFKKYLNFITINKSQLYLSFEEFYYLVNDI